ncbi:MAG: hypothetical protein ACTHMI_10625 [Mucilaginibacter sp.]
MLKNEFTLIDGTFTGSEANELLSTLFMDKLRFHNIKNLSHLERFGKPDVQAEKRIQGLEETLEDVLKFLKNYDQEKEFEIHADIKIKPLNNPKL